jgi:hypothetical protein
MLHEVSPQQLLYKKAPQHCVVGPKQFLGVCFDADPGWEKFGSGIRDGMVWYKINLGI